MLRPPSGRVLLVVASLVLAESQPTAFGQTSPPAVTFSKVLEYLDVGVAESRIKSMIERSPATFVLGEEQVRQLQAAGASEELIALMQQRKGAATAGNDITDLIVILDCSGSMNDKMVAGMTKWEAARQATLDLIQGIPAGRRLSLIAYGCDARLRCQSVDVLRPLSTLEASEKPELMRIVNALGPVGQTPIALALQAAATELEKAAGLASVVLITDGAESCGGNPEQEARKLRERFDSLQGGVNVIGFDLKNAESAATAAIAEAGGGRYYSAQTGNELINSLRKAARSRVAETVDLTGLSPIDRLLIEQLKDDTRSVREAAARTIRERNVKAAVPALINLIAEGPWVGGLYGDSDRDEAMLSLLQLAPERAAEALGDAFVSSSFYVRCWAADAVLEHKVTSALDSVESRILGLTDLDVEPRGLDGYREANKLFDCLKELDQPRLERIMVQLLRSNFRNVKTWAAEKVADL